jgi:hypothetical protein
MKNKFFYKMSCPSPDCSGSFVQQIPIFSEDKRATFTAGSSFCFQEKKGFENKLQVESRNSFKKNG